MQRRERESGLSRKEVIVWLCILFGILFVSAVVILSPFFPSVGTPVAARRSLAGTETRNIVSAVKSYESDYGHFPEIVKPLPKGRKTICVGDPACKISDGPNSLLLDVLRAIPRGPNANHALNPKQVVYYEGPIAKDVRNPRSGFADGPAVPAADRGCLFDPWGHQYCILFTTDGSGKLDLSAVYSDLAGPANLVPSPVAAFSLGKDGISGGKGYEGKFRKPGSSEPPDDIVSWQ